MVSFGDEGGHGALLASPSMSTDRNGSTKGVASRDTGEATFYIMSDEFCQPGAA